MPSLLRLLKHRWHDAGDARRALGPGAVERIAERVRASERALTLFGKLRVWDTAHNNGVLIYLLLAEHRIEIVADRGLDRHVGAARWQAIVDGMGEAFRERRFEEGLAAAVDAVDALLRQHFPLAPGAANPNELPDKPLVG